MMGTVPALTVLKIVYFEVEGLPMRKAGTRDEQLVTEMFAWSNVQQEHSILCRGTRCTVQRYQMHCAEVPDADLMGSKTGHGASLIVTMLVTIKVWDFSSI